MSVHVLVAIVRKRLGLDASLYQILQILSLTLFEKTPILQALQPSDSGIDLFGPTNQLILSDVDNRTIQSKIVLDKCKESRVYLLSTRTKFRPDQRTWKVLKRGGG